MHDTEPKSTIYQDNTKRGGGEMGLPVVRQDPVGEHEPALLIAWKDTGEPRLCNTKRHMQASRHYLSSSLSISAATRTLRPQLLCHHSMVLLIYYCRSHSFYVSVVSIGFTKNCTSTHRESRSISVTFAAFLSADSLDKFSESERKKIPNHQMKK